MDVIKVMIVRDYEGLKSELNPRTRICHKKDAQRHVFYG
jgi:hypothetical protein